jgi:hypothetical protein
MVHAANAALATVSAAYWSAALHAATYASMAVSRTDPPTCDPNELKHQAGMLRCLLGNPFRTVLVVEPAWRTPAVMGIAATIAEEEAFGLMPVLGAALSDARCRETSILEHCRTANHVRGCFHVDMLLGKE